ncbi:protein-methionine-sulfoxide reductase heme-binding subunit MsrQ (plasmid) [Paracoccus sp. TK19116]|uniref:Protein-methionine-sulfoxide reductase heme-binding subunit MsrQ n=1 Tax=Paracoccus albicereus TaxID=2922394 RepID=A0ABT1MMI9_9RHOB|nr:protein-methionine-sulfoxide reductase heme-binding subunit MsrQ [Paracoccus albicereus]MCQ0969503.1 protein-methionine-sulfoxide reductase heme-binding subunit MsrQ [Paracoccus albicereus]
MERALNRYARMVPVWAVWLGGMIPLALLVFDTLTNRLGIDPVRDIEHRLGRTALYFLIATLLVTPVLRLTRVNLIRFRRALGLITFTYAVLHVAAWIGFDMGLVWSQMLRDVVKRPYLIFGMVAFVILIALAVTSNNASIRKMGSGGWRRLHKLIYIAAPVAALHWLWALKVWEVKPLAILAVILALLALRVVVPRPLGRKPARA